MDLILQLGLLWIIILYFKHTFSRPSTEDDGKQEVTTDDHPCDMCRGEQVRLGNSIIACPKCKGATG